MEIKERIGGGYIVYSTYNDMKTLLETHKNIVEDCKRQLENNKEEIEKLMLKDAPKGYSGGTSYVDADCVHGSKPELRYDILEKFIDEQNKLYHMIEVSTNSIEYYQKVIDGLNRQWFNL